MFPLRVFACVKSKLSILVIPGLDPGIQGGRDFHLPLDCRVKPGNDEGVVLARLVSGTRFTSRRDAVGGKAFVVGAGRIGDPLQVRRQVGQWLFCRRWRGETGRLLDLMIPVRCPDAVAFMDARLP